MFDGSLDLTMLNPNAAFGDQSAPAFFLGSQGSVTGGRRAAVRMIPSR
ncbi:MAG: hypothetical protein GDA36_10995 [Rhodobacteraceae bacterium]|nr:hypothetical protein [Paracoccaceae bacterium]